jgi:mRNA-degrading endonuclease RelE of RelBE toxin-antitoxin system
MSWVCSLSHQAAKALRTMPSERQRQLAQAIDEMSQDPTTGDVRPIKNGRFRGALRKRVGPYRIVYSVDPRGKEVAIAAILARAEGTYR